MTLLYGFKYSELTLIIYTQLYGFKVDMLSNKDSKQNLLNYNNVESGCEIFISKG